MDKQIIIIPSEKMDNNQKAGRDEHKLIRMPKVARDKLDPGGKGLNLEGEKESRSLAAFKAYSEDVKKQQCPQSVVSC